MMNKIANNLSLLISNSPALARYLEGQPTEAKIVAGLATDGLTKTLEHFRSNTVAICKKSLPNSDPDQYAEIIRKYKYNSLCILANKYLERSISAEEFCRHWSRVAENCCELAYSYFFSKEESLEKKYKFVVIAVGKLGSEELNLSSDIDLIFLSNSTTHEETEISFKIAFGITKMLSSVGNSGFCFRVDTDLRPEGKQGPICNTVDSAVTYYEYWGSEMERMMLIRANPIAGDLELGKEFISKVRSFVYRRSWDVSSLKKIKDVKLQIEAEASKSMRQGINIKLGYGGIREVEFIVQSIQLLHGGKDKAIIVRNTFDAIRTIKKNGLLPKRECDELLSAYTFFRHLENMLQLPEEQQTHNLPIKPEDWESLATRMGYGPKTQRTAINQLMVDYDKHTEIIKRYFEHIFRQDLEKQQMEEALLTNLSTCRTEEEEVDSLPWFKKEELKRIQYLDLENKITVSQVSEQLNLVAEVVIAEAYKLSAQGLRKTYGPPLIDEKGKTIAGLAIVGMGKLGGKEIDYASDLDLMFIFSANGTTAGPRVISNQEYFTKLSQRIISLLSLPTRYGKAYMIDTDLRPSGRSGVLVTSLDSFKDYHLMEAQIWERQALLKARPVGGDPKFCEIVEHEIRSICFDLPIPADLKEQIHDLRMRMEKEKAGEGKDRYNIKLGRGGLMDIETIVQYSQLKNGIMTPNLQTQSTTTCLEYMAHQRIIDEEDAKYLIMSYRFFKELLSRIRLFSNHSTDLLRPSSEKLDQISKSLNFANKTELINKFLECREKNRKTYEKYLT